MAIDSASVRSYAEDWLVNPNSELEVSAAFRFLTSAKSLLTKVDDGAVRFTDIGFLHAGLGYSFARRFEASGGVDLLAKQPSYLDEPVYYGSDLGLRMALAEKWALWGSLAAGPMLRHQGIWGENASGVRARTSIHETIRFQASLGGAFTRLFYEEGGWPWFVEVAAHGEAMLREERGKIAAWIGVDYRVPVIHDGQGRDIDPSVRLNVQVGAMLGYVENWDIYALVTSIDRGDVDHPATTLPILDGGFDQTQIVLGAAHRFDLEDDHRRDRVYRIGRPSAEPSSL